ncbi:DUF839 domain-containing protein [Brevundimonas sp. 2R-24]|uniref:DUF839 domain-containing protein n=1 Tax=Peiella sedimenti TaxID=3061083 RepID=A0ABT8SJD4_9CAUL|nr:DUF839 domain-containing protein [Caulobacteraceae bacterium XZ-24]
MPLSRRAALKSAAALAFSGLAARVAAQAAGDAYRNEVEGYGPLISDPRGVFDLPEGFSYQVISQVGDTMDDGLFTPGRADGMGCFALEGSRVALVRNHELRHDRTSHINLGPGGVAGERNGLIDAAKAYDRFADGRPLPGGTTTLIYDLQSRQVVRQHLSLIGTSTNCAGGVTPWGSWLTCEEITRDPGQDGVNQKHGYVFEVTANSHGLTEARPLPALGRFDHEAACVDPRTGVVYLTEDESDGLFYRFVPERPGDLAAGGRLQAMAFKDARGGSSANRAERVWGPGDWRDVVWIDIEDVDSAGVRRRGHAAGATLVARGEGIHWGDGELYLTATSGGPIERGQILRYVPSRFEGQVGERLRPGRIQLFLEATDERVYNMGDNLTVAPNGHLLVCEDNYSDDIYNHLRGVTPEGRVYTIGRNIYPGNSELAGACFSPDGSVLFLNLQTAGLTLAVRGPWDRVRTS